MQSSLWKQTSHRIEEAADHRRHWESWWIDYYLFYYRWNTKGQSTIYSTRRFLRFLLSTINNSFLPRWTPPNTRIWSDGKTAVARPDLGNTLLAPLILRCDHGYIDLSLFLVSFENKDITAIGRFRLMMKANAEGARDRWWKEKRRKRKKEKKFL